jgi:Glycine zipper
MRRRKIFACAVWIALLCSSVYAADVFVYPTKKQSKEQQEKDEFACHKWAKEKTGIDPMAPAAAAPVQSAPQGGPVRGAAKGAAVGAIGGAIGGNAGKGAAVGAGVGGTLGAMRRARSQRQQAEALQEHYAAQKDAQGTFLRAFTACMEGRGYTVK